jgi:hypothetical protein
VRLWLMLGLLSRRRKRKTVPSDVREVRVSRCSACAVEDQPQPCVPRAVWNSELHVSFGFLHARSRVVEFCRKINTSLTLGAVAGPTQPVPPAPPPWQPHGLRSAKVSDID